MKNKQAILIVGNSPNRLQNSGPSWDQLLQELHGEVGMPAGSQKEKPATLHYDEMVHRYAELKNGTPLAFAELVARKMQNMQANSIHQAIMSLPFRDVLTTNYDHCLEQAAASNAKADFGTKERRYSLFRRRKAGSRHVWHVHGDIERPTSIMMGHESYIESASRIRRYCDPTLGIEYRGTGMLKARFKEPTWKPGPNEPHSWVDLFMVSDVHVAGLTMDFSEADLWYLISYKRRQQREKKITGRASGTRLYFHDFTGSDPAKAARHEILKSFGAEIILHPLNDKNYLAAWQGLIETLRTMV